MNKIITSMLAAATVASVPALPMFGQSGPISAEMQIRLAVQAVAPSMRDSATVQGYDASGVVVTLRQGSNDLICMAPNPSAERFEVSCHQAGLEPFFARGRELRAQGITGEQRERTRWNEYTAGKLPIPFGTTNHILTGSGFDPATGEIRDPYLRWVIYVPNATVASTGLSERPAVPGAPWLMFPGTPGAHVMIVPPRPNAGGGN